MSDIVIYTIITVSAIGVVAAIILYLAAQKFKVYEDPRIDKVEEALPLANCGGCGYPGCRNFAEECVKADNLDLLFCPVGGNELMKTVAAILEKDAVEKAPQVAVIRCSGSFEHRPKINNYDGASNCTINAQLYSGDTGCEYGCLGLGECVDACTFDAMYMDEQTGLPVVIEDKCTSCGDCVRACPKDIIELRNKGKKDRRIFVSCINADKGGVAKKNCAVACIGCTKCEKECKYDAIVIENFLAYIDFNKCVLCRKCAPVCPTNAILEINFPPKKERVPKVEDKGVLAEKQADENTNLIELAKKNNDPEAKG
ncbi:MAG: Fe-S cluster domain-containing protein [Bacteroidales bacterium]|nr:Fe-S cluster domain-containing protein [Bacteroidales bacterium]